MLQHRRAWKILLRALDAVYREGHLSLNSCNAISSFPGHALIDRSCVNDTIFEPSLHYVIFIRLAMPWHEIWDRFMRVGNSILKPWLFRSSPSLQLHHWIAFAYNDGGR
jgi:hypothetical protein